MKNEYTPQYVSPPGNTIGDMLEERGLSEVDLVSMSGLSTDTVAGLMTGETVITMDIAERLHRAIGGSVEFWLAREERYRESIARRPNTANLYAKK